MMKRWASNLYSTAAEIKNYLYDGGLLDSIRVSSPVISVGNLTMGGTGKTPVVDLLLSYLESQGKNVALVSRNYKAQLRGFHELHREVQNGATLFGDEPWMLAQKHPRVRVYVGPIKSETLFRAHRKNPADVYVIDDGFQHRALHRDLDLVLVDVSQPPESLSPIPMGQAREKIQNLNRADAVLFTKTDLVSEGALAVWEQEIRHYFQGPLIFLRRQISAPEFVGQRVFAFSGIAQPLGFEKLFMEGAAAFEFLRFPDHHLYTQEDIAKILRQAEDFDLLLTTEKDWVKIAGTELGRRAQVVTLRMEIVKGESEFYALVDSILR